MIKLNKYFKLLLILLIIIIIITIIIYLIQSFLETNNYIDYNNYLFMTKYETQEFIKNDNDKYIKNLSIYDLRARKVSSNDEYKTLVINSCLDFSQEQKNKLILCANNAKKYFNNNEKWIFALINNNYEEGFPHTRNKIIFLSPNIINYNDIELTKTLIHESIHIYQRYNKKEIAKYLADNHFSFSRHKPLVSLIRANPDLDKYIYKDKNNIELVAYYNSKNPNSINDINLTNYSYEHPFEKMAYEIAEDYYKLTLLKYKDI